ncbi:hypothetical protein N9P79_00810 [Crocinitomicaceae bacterium]|jgi:hypothetical protein|nr:hypothetical protein [Crocinitomicaceae bacterium]MDB4074962.1 hypothetical protein [Crocinitomicaceae bacterium]MDC0099363.1 hypothetical protein [Crocinitomicaceae bacterium]MDC1385005.1 hypothetical protein [Crocinitomicaceae bacterium]|tara:strand:- start:225 stop:644 length:420 start_codon:yes stop_codon:yes gene_type:complete
MKNLLFISTLLIGLSACDMADDSDYEGMASDLCGCFNEATAGLSDEGRKVIEDAGENGIDTQTALMEFTQEDPIQGMKDAQILQGLGDGDFMSCVNDLESKYNDVYTTGTEAEIQEKLIDAMKDVKKCKLTYAFMKGQL